MAAGTPGHGAAHALLGARAAGRGREPAAAAARSHRPGKAAGAGAAKPLGS